MAARYTDLALEAHELWRQASGAQTLPGTEQSEHRREGFGVTRVLVRTEEASRLLGKPRGVYLTLDLRGRETMENGEARAARAVAAELRTLPPLRRGAARGLVVCLGSAAMTPDALGPRAAAHILVTRHLAAQLPSLAAVSVLTPGVLGSTGLEAAEQARGAVRAVRAELVIAIDALASQRLGRVCTTVQLSDTGIIPGSGVGNHRGALTQETLGVPVVAVGVPTVVDAATLALDVLEEAGAPLPPRGTLAGASRALMVTPRSIDAQVSALARIVGLGVSAALHPSLSPEELALLMN